MGEKMNTKKVLQEIVDKVGWDFLFTELQDICFDRGYSILYCELDNIIVNYLEETQE